MAIDEQRQLGRAKNAILEFFEERLSVPKIYFDADWNGALVDVLAIDRDGVGDVHAVLLYNRNYTDEKLLDIPVEQRVLAGMLDKFASIQAQYKYIGGVHSFHKDDLASVSVVQHGIPVTYLDESFAQDGVGRVGYVTVSASTRGGLKTSLDLKPERFRASVAELADKYIENHAPDWEIRA